MAYKCTCKSGQTWSGNNDACNDNASKCRQCCSGKHGGVASVMTGRRQGYRNASGAGVVQAGLQGGLVVGLLVVGVLIYAMVRVSQTK